DHLAVMKGFTKAGERRDMVEALLHQTNLYDVRKKRLYTFSGSMHQRFGIARSLIGNPELLIVDEPTAGLDPEERNRFYNLLSEIGEEVVLILSTHIVEDVAVLSSNMAVMAAGEVVLQGTPSDLLARYEGFVWDKMIQQSALLAYGSSLDLISTHFSAGKMLARVMSKDSPDHGFEQS